VNPRCRLVVPVSDGGVVPKSLTEFDVNQEWKVDEKFSSSSRVVKVPLIVGKAVAPEQKEDPADTGIGSSVEEDRKHLLEASLIRVMKGRKSLEHNNLVAEVMGLMSNRFVPSVDAIKARIENLIEREFIRRDEADPKVYHYVA
jgi:cullin 3